MQKKKPWQKEKTSTIWKDPTPPMQKEKASTPPMQKEKNPTPGQKGPSPAPKMNPRQGPFINAQSLYDNLVNRRFSEGNYLNSDEIISCLLMENVSLLYCPLPLQWA